MKIKNYYIILLAFAIGGITPLMVILEKDNEFFDVIISLIILFLHVSVIIITIWLKIFNKGTIGKWLRSTTNNLSKQLRDE